MKIFSRNQEDNTGKYPDIISRTPKVGVCHPHLPPARAAVTGAEHQGSSRPARCGGGCGLWVHRCLFECGVRLTMDLRSCPGKRTFVSLCLPLASGPSTSHQPQVPFHFQIKLPSVTSFILDAEAVAWDREKKQIQPFQVLTTRKRKVASAALHCLPWSHTPSSSSQPCPCPGGSECQGAVFSAFTTWLPQLQPLHSYPSMPSRNEEDSIFLYLCFIMRDHLFQEPPQPAPQETLYSHWPELCHVTTDSCKAERANTLAKGMDEAGLR